MELLDASLKKKKKKNSRVYLQTKYLIGLVPSSLTREFNLHIGTILNCLAFVRKYIECNLI